MGDTPANPQMLDCAIIGGSVFIFSYNFVGLMPFVEGLGPWAIMPFSAFVGGAVGSFVADIVSKKTYDANWKQALMVGAYAAAGSFGVEMILRLLNSESRILTALGASIAAWMSTCSLPYFSNT